MVALREQVDLTVEKGAKLKSGTDQKSPLEGGKGGENVSAYNTHPGSSKTRGIKKRSLSLEKGANLQPPTDQKVPP